MPNEFIVKNGLISQGNITISGSITATGGVTVSGSIASASYASNAELLDGLDSTVFTLTSSFNAQTASFTAFTSSMNSFSASILTNVTALNAKTASFATTGSNTFVGAEVISGSLAISGSGTPFTLNTDTLEITGSLLVTGSTTLTGSLLQLGNFTTTGTIIAQTINVQTVTSSIVYSSGSNVFGNSLGNSQTFTGSVLITGSLTIAGASSATSYNGATIFGSTIVCSPIGCFTTSCATSFIGGTMSGTTIYGSTVACSPIGCFATSCATSFIGGTMSGTTIYGSTMVCAASLKAQSGFADLTLCGSNTTSPHLGGTFTITTNQDGNGRTIIGNADVGRAMYLEAGGTFTFLCAATFSNNILIGAGKYLGYSSTAYMTPEDNIQGARIKTPGAFLVESTGATFCSNLTVAKSDASNDILLKVQQLSNTAAAGIGLVSNVDGLASYNFIYSATNAGSEHWKIFGNGTANTLAIQTGGTTRLTISSNGTATINSTTYIPFKLNSSYGQIGLEFQLGGTGFASIGSASNVTGAYTGSETDLGLGTNASATANIIFATGAGSTRRMTITCAGDVGIGITADNPIGNGGTYRNLLVGNGAGYGVFQGISTATATDSTIVAFSGGTTGASANKNGGSINLQLDATSTGRAIGRWVFYTNSATAFEERMRITSGGLIGMNQPAPSYRLEICSPSSTCLLGLMGASNVNIDMVGFGTSLTYPQARIQLQDDGYYGGMLSFFTKPNGAQANALTERMRICSNGDLTIKGNTHCIYTNAAATISFDINVTRGRFYQALTVDGTLTKGGGSFKIDHPLESKKDTYNLYHSFVESPKADLIYRGKVALTDGYATVNIDTAADMSEGTFEVLVKDVQCFTTNENGWNFVKGTISGNILTIESDNTNCNDEISWMVIGERNDKWFRESTMVDENGKTIVEKLKSETT